MMMVVVVISRSLALEPLKKNNGKMFRVFHLQRGLAVHDIESNPRKRLHPIRKQNSWSMQRRSLSSSYAVRGASHLTTPALPEPVIRSSLALVGRGGADAAFRANPNLLTVRMFQNESEYHSVADETLDTIQDAIDDALDATPVEYELTLASGVLTLVLPPHGTWVINKQTPNRQLWWSSPLSGPKRFEYDDEREMWYSTKDSSMPLGPSLASEIQEVVPQEIEEFEIKV